MIEYTGNGVNYQRKNRDNPGKGVVKKKTVCLNKDELAERNVKKKCSLWCTYTELCWLKNLLYYRREKLGLEDKKTRSISMAGTEESLLELINMNPKRNNTKKYRQQWTGLDKIEQSSNWDSFD